MSSATRFLSVLRQVQAAAATNLPGSVPVPVELFHRIQVGTGKIAHRAGSPENTLEAMRRAHAAGAVAVEGVGPAAGPRRVSLHRPAMPHVSDMGRAGFRCIAQLWRMPRICAGIRLHALFANEARSQLFVL